MQLGDFHQYIEDTLNLGTTVTAFIDDEVRKAALNLERNNNFLYMENFRQPTIAAAATSLALTSGIKAIKMFREVKADGEYRYFQQIHPEDIDVPDPNDVQSPQFFWLDGNAGGTPLAQLNMAAPATLNIDLIEVLFTTWPTSPTEEPWLLKWGEDLMLYQTLIQMCFLPIVRDPELASMLTPLKQEALVTVLATDDELRQSVSRPEMRYGREY